jgi:hypothetical protein
MSNQNNFFIWLESNHRLKRLKINKKTLNRDKKSVPISKIFKIFLAILSSGRENSLKWKKIIIPMTIVAKIANKERKINIFSSIIKLY